MKFLIATNDQADGPGTEPFGYLRALQSLEHETDLFYYRKKSFLYSNIRSTWIRQMNARLVKRVQTWNPDVLLVFRGGYITADSIESINRTTSCVTVNFYPDNPFGLASYPPLSFDALLEYQIFLTRDRYFEQELKAAGASNVHYMPHGYDPVFYRPFSRSAKVRDGFGGDGSFVGAVYPFRTFLLVGLTEPGTDLRIWGRPNWKTAGTPWLQQRYRGGPITQDEKLKVYASSRINLNLQHPGGSIFGLDERSFGIIGTGGFLLVNHKRDIEKYFELGEEVDTYRNREDLQQKIKLYLSQPEETAKMAHKAMERAQREHTHRNRVARLIDMVVRLK